MSTVPSEITTIIERTFHIRTPIGVGTAFFIDVEDSQYLITAKHVIANAVDSLAPAESIRIGSDSGSTAVVHVARLATGAGDPDAGGIDIAVLELQRKFPFSYTSPPIAGPQDLYPTQEVIMPSAELWTAFGSASGITFRNGSISRVNRLPERSVHMGEFTVAIEAYGGFSGSPVFCRDEEKTLKLAGVAARYSWQQIPNLGNAFVHTGMLGCFYMQHALDAINDLGS